MRLEDCFEFEKFDTEHGEVERIRIKGSRVAVEHVIEKFKAGMEPREIRERFPTLTLAEVYATIAYYLANQETVEAYIGRGERVADAYYQEYLENGPYWLRDKALRKRAAQEGPPDKPAHE
jgi:uncharacterized protein (DUF433 family)